MPWCPQCGAEFESGVSTCSDCSVPLTPMAPAHVEHVPRERTVVAYMARDDVEAALITELLTAAGIPNFRDMEMPDSIFPITIDEVASVRLEVFDHDLEAARRVIDEFKYSIRNPTDPQDQTD